MLKYTKDGQMVGGKFQKIRKSKRLSIETLAERSDVDIQEIKDIESGVDIEKSLKTYRRLATALNITLGDLYRGIYILNRN